MNALTYELYTRPLNIKASEDWVLVADFLSNDEAVDFGRRQQYANPTLEFRVVSSENEETHFEEAIADFQDVIDSRRESIFKNL